MAFPSNATYPDGASYPTTCSFPSGFSVTPNQYTNLALWVSAEDIVKDSADRVSSMTDLSGNGRTLSQVAAMNQPLWLANQLNTRPCIRFNGTTETMSTVVFALNQPFTVYLLLKQTSYSNGSRILARPDAQQVIIHQSTSASGRIEIYAGTGGPTTSNNVAIGQYVIWNQQFFTI
jgi:hypothetical protein